MLRVNNGVLVVPPFECAWLTGDGYTLRSGSGCVSFEAKGETDITVILKSTPGAKRLQPAKRQAPGQPAAAAGHGNALQVEENYTIIFGSHRNSCLKIEKNGVTECMVTGVACSRASSKTFSHYWIDLNHGVLTVGHGEPGAESVCYQWRDTQEIPGIQHIGLSCWDRHVSYRSIVLRPSLDFTRLQQQQAAEQLRGAASAVPPLFDTVTSAIMAATTPANVCRALHVAELLLPTTQKLYRYCLDYIARHFEAVAVQSPDSLRSLSPAAMCDLVCQNTFSVDEQGIFAGVRDWALSYLATGGAGGETCGEGGPGEGATEGAAGAEAEAEAGGSGLAWGSGPGPGPSLAAEERLERAAGGSPRALSAPELALDAAVSAVLASASSDTSAAGGGGGAGSLRSAGCGQGPSRALGSGSGSGGELGLAAAAGGGGAEEAAAVCRVLSLIRFPLLPIEQLRACLADPLLGRLPAVLGLVHEALEVHRRETGAAATEAAAAAPGGASAGAGLVTCPSYGRAACTGAAERRLVTPAAGLVSGASGSGAGAVGPDPAAAAAASSSAAASSLTTQGSLTAPAGAAAAAPGAAADSANWAVRYQRRCLPFALELMYVCDGDSSGVLHFLGTQYGSQGWVNPMLAKRVDVRASSPTGRTTDPRAVVGRQFVRTNFAGPRYVNGAASSWWQVDLGEQHQLAITFYTLRHDGSPDFPRSWVLQGSNDLVTWVDLKRHAGDTSIKLPGQYASWPVIGPAAAVPYRAFRLLLTAPNASPNPASRHNLCLSNLEFYGFLHKGGGAAAAATAAAATAAESGAASGSGAEAGAAAAAGAAPGVGPCEVAGGGDTAAPAASEGSDAGVKAEVTPLTGAAALGASGA
ncbi:hypothetical protein HYH03_017937 [Edaphochlamys debaryana]|uniref:Uncharacterized protein n=1 Tax=Edaphochlamys debaryana TaxID=47281 RepID=A0A835XI46_9CHLO|nr:hypothetical protein HYH03_017937 [Edaphochlamys debaryana]|eukprot:KAG2483203.1 hypothetical protein HYH03_017937 [Edaphochlamys debaryana]